MHLRPYSPDDISSLAEIEGTCNLEDPLALYMYKDIGKKWTSYKSASARFLHTKILQPGTVCWVAETDKGDVHTGDQGKSGDGGEVVGWAIWTRNGSSAVAKNWQKLDNGLPTRIERVLHNLSNRYYDTFDDPAADHAHRKAIDHLLSMGPDPAILGEHWAMNGLYVAKAYHRQGIGAMLLKWGIDQAQAEDVPIFLKASPTGFFLYEKMGFKSIEERDFSDFFEAGFKGMHDMLWEPSSHNDELLRKLKGVVV